MTIRIGFDTFYRPLDKNEPSVRLDMYIDTHRCIELLEAFRQALLKYQVFRKARWRKAIFYHGEHVIDGKRSIATDFEVRAYIQEKDPSEKVYTETIDDLFDLEADDDDVPSFSVVCESDEEITPEPLFVTSEEEKSRLLGVIDRIERAEKSEIKAGKYSRKMMMAIRSYCEAVNQPSPCPAHTMVRHRVANWVTFEEEKRLDDRRKVIRVKTLEPAVTASVTSNGTKIPTKRHTPSTSNGVVLTTITHQRPRPSPIQGVAQPALKTVSKPWLSQRQLESRHYREQLLEYEDEKSVAEILKTEKLQRQFCAYMNKLSPANVEQLAPEIRDFIANSSDYIIDFIDMCMYEHLCVDEPYRKTYIQFLKMLPNGYRASFLGEIRSVFEHGYVPLNDALAMARQAWSSSAPSEEALNKRTLQQVNAKIREFQHHYIGVISELFLNGLWSSQNVVDLLSSMKAVHAREGDAETIQLAAELLERTAVGVSKDFSEQLHALAAWANEELQKPSLCIKAKYNFYRVLTILSNLKQDTEGPSSSSPDEETNAASGIRQFLPTPTLKAKPNDTSMLNLNSTIGKISPTPLINPKAVVVEAPDADCSFLTVTDVKPAAIPDSYRRLPHPSISPCPAGHVLVQVVLVRREAARHDLPPLVQHFLPHRPKRTVLEMVRLLQTLYRWAGYPQQRQADGSWHEPQLDAHLPSRATFRVYVKLFKKPEEQRLALERFDQALELDQSRWP